MTAIAPDGSPVAFYRRLPATGEPELVHELLGPGMSILDLGCGPGRIAGPLAALGHRVTGVDNGEGMIAALPPDVEGIVGDASTTRLGRTFDAVLLASHLVNDPAHGRAFVDTAAAHLAPGGTVIGETYPPGWDPMTGVGVVGRLGDATIVVPSATVTEGVLHAVVRYGVDGTEWEQSFAARILDEDALPRMLQGAGLRFAGWLERPGWFTAGWASGAPRG